MIHDHSIAASAEDQGLECAIGGPFGPWAGFKARSELGPEQRLELIDQALRPVDELIDAYPLAL